MAKPQLRAEQGWIFDNFLMICVQNLYKNQRMIFVKILKNL